jgi:hypothetical protein
MDPFEGVIVELFERRKEIAKEHIKKIIKEEEEQEERIPYSINKTISYLKSEEYLRQRKSLKKLND